MGFKPSSTNLSDLDVTIGTSSVISVDEVNKRVGIGTTSPDKTLTVVGAFGCSGSVTLGNADTDVTTVTGQLTASQGATFMGHTYITGAMRISASADSYITGGPNDYPAALIVTGTLPNEGVLLRVENANLNAGTGYGAAAYFKYDDLYVALCDKNGSTGGNQGIETNGSIELAGDLYLGGSGMNVRASDAATLMTFRGHSAYDPHVLVNAPLRAFTGLTVTGSMSISGSMGLHDAPGTWVNVDAPNQFSASAGWSLHLTSAAGVTLASPSATTGSTELEMVLPINSAVEEILVSITTNGTSSAGGDGYYTLCNVAHMLTGSGDVTDMWWYGTEVEGINEGMNRQYSLDLQNQQSQPHVVLKPPADGTFFNGPWSHTTKKIYLIASSSHSVTTPAVVNVLMTYKTYDDIKTPQ